MYYGEVSGIPDTLKNECKKLSEAEVSGNDFLTLSNFISRLCIETDKPVILIIDEVDQASSQEQFLAFLGMLRAKYLKREKRPTFQTVILAGVYDIKNLKSKMRDQNQHQYNSPWNIAADFTLDMSFSTSDIAGMLKEYESDQHTGMDIQKVAEEIYDYTSGYPFLVSYICKLIDEELPESGDFAGAAKAWSPSGVAYAVKEILGRPATLFDDMRKKISDYPKLRDMLYAILFYGKSFPYNPDNYAIDIGIMFGFIGEKNGMTVIANRIFETRLYNWFMSEEILKRMDVGFFCCI